MARPGYVYVAADYRESRALLSGSGLYQHPGIGYSRLGDAINASMDPIQRMFIAGSMTYEAVGSTGRKQNVRIPGS